MSETATSTPTGPGVAEKAKQAQEAFTETSKGIIDSILTTLNGLLQAEAEEGTEPNKAQKFVNFMSEKDNEKKIKSFMKMVSYGASMTNNNRARFVTDILQTVSKMDYKTLKEKGFTEKHLATMVEGAVDTGLNNVTLRMLKKYLPPEMRMISGMVSEFASEILGGVSGNIIGVFGLKSTKQYQKEAAEAAKAKREQKGTAPGASESTEKKKALQDQLDALKAKLEELTGNGEAKAQPESTQTTEEPEYAEVIEEEIVGGESTDVSETGVVPYDSEEVTLLDQAGNVIDLDGNQAAQETEEEKQKKTSINDNLEAQQRQAEKAAEKAAEEGNDGMSTALEEVKMCKIEPVLKCLPVAVDEQPGTLDLEEFDKKRSQEKGARMGVGE